MLTSRAKLVFTCSKKCGFHKISQKCICTCIYVQQKQHNTGRQKREEEEEEFRGRLRECIIDMNLICWGQKKTRPRLHLPSLNADDAQVRKSKSRSSELESESSYRFLKVGLKPD